MIMKIIRADNKGEMGIHGAHILAERIKAKPDCVLGLATGSTPLGVYKCLRELNKVNEIDFSNVRTVNLDEYCGLGNEDPQSYHSFMMNNLFNHINIDKNNVHILSGKAIDVDAECARYEAAIRSLGGIDIQLLGVGHNGHIGFNEPSDEFAKDTHCVELTERTIAANALFFPSIDDVPRRALSMGIRTIMHARKVMLLCSGESKAETLEKALFGPITPRMPASILQVHPDFTVVADEAALSIVAKRHPHMLV